MTMLFGFELEAFYSSDGKTVELPPKDYPKDGFPGLVELRTRGGSELYTAFGALLKQINKYPNLLIVDNHLFSPEQIRKLRETHSFNKEPLVVSNVYDLKASEPKKEISAAFQINLSKTLTEEYTDSKGSFHSRVDCLLDPIPLVKTLDAMFEKDIKETGREPGWYAIKGSRLEYRSLPATVVSNYSVLQLLSMLENVK